MFDAVHNPSRRDMTAEEIIEEVIVPSDPDPAINDLLKEARRMHLEHDPVFTWEQLRTIILAGGRLGELHRHPSIEKVYEEKFNPALEKAHGSVKDYLLKQLSWTEEELDHGHLYWIRDAPARIRLNDWAYSCPKDVTHHVVWVPITLFHQDLCKPTKFSEDDSSSFAELWEQVQRDGLGGETGTNKSLIDDDGPHREILAFVREKWNEEEYDTLWFANPPTLQSVKELAHFHVLVRPRKKLEEKA